MLTLNVTPCKTVEEGAMNVINEFGRVLEINFKSNDVIDKMNEIIYFIDEKAKKEYEDLLNYDSL